MMSADSGQHPDTLSSLHESQDDETESTSEDPRWSSLDSVIPTLGEEQISCNMPASNAVPDETYTVEPAPIDSPSSYTLPTGSVDPKTALTIAYDLDNSTGAKKCNVNPICNETFELDGPKDISGHGAYCLDNNSAAKALSPVIFRSGSDTGPSYSIAECHYRPTVDEKGATRKEKVDMCGLDAWFPDFEVTGAELNGHPPFHLDADGNVEKMQHATSTPVNSPAGNGFDGEPTMKPSPNNMEHKCFEHASTGVRRMLHLCQTNSVRPIEEPFVSKCTSQSSMKTINSDVNTLDKSASEHDKYDEVSAGSGGRKFDQYKTGPTRESATEKCTSESFPKSEANILDKSLDVPLPDEGSSNDEVFTGATGCILDQTYSIRVSAGCAVTDFSTDLSHFEYVRQRDSVDHRAMLAMEEKSGICDSRFVVSQRSDEQSHVFMVDDSSLSIIDVYNDENAASFFLTDWPDVMAGDSDDLLPLGQSLPLAQRCQEDISLAAPRVRVILPSPGLLSQSDLITNWSFSDLTQDLPSFDNSSMNEQASSHHSWMRHLSTTTRLSSEFGQETYRLNHTGKYRSSIYHF